MPKMLASFLVSFSVCSLVLSVGGCPSLINRKPTAVPSTQPSASGPALTQQQAQAINNANVVMTQFDNANFIFQLASESDTKLESFAPQVNDLVNEIDAQTGMFTQAVASNQSINQQQAELVIAKDTIALVKLFQLNGFKATGLPPTTGVSK